MGISPRPYDISQGRKQPAAQLGHPRQDGGIYKATKTMAGMKDHKGRPIRTSAHAPMLKAVCIRGYMSGYGLFRIRQKGMGSVLRGCIPWVAHVHAKRAQWSWRWRQGGGVLALLSCHMVRPRRLILGGFLNASSQKKNITTI